MPIYFAGPWPARLAALLLAATLNLGHAQQPPAAAAVRSASVNKNLAPGFSTRPAASRLVVLPPDMELFSISAGGVSQPRADWTEAAQGHFQRALGARSLKLGAQVTPPDARQMEEFAELQTLHRALADAVFIHHTSGGLKLPTKQDRLDWSLGDAVQPLRERTGADYALFTWVRDSYASGERKAALLAMALLGAIPLGGQQIGYASLVDLHTGRIVWFNELSRFWGDLREAKPAEETLEALLKGLPAVEGERP